MCIRDRTSTIKENCKLMRAVSRNYSKSELLIIAKGYKYLLTQIDDFLDSARTIVISLKSVKGRKEYEQLFGRKLDDQKTNIKIRIISLKQSRLTDFISNLFEKSMSRYSIFDQMLSEYSNLKILFIEKIVTIQPPPNQLANIDFDVIGTSDYLSLIHISEPTRLLSISYAVFCLKKKKKKNRTGTL